MPREGERSSVLFWALLLSVGAHVLTGAVASASLARMPPAQPEAPAELPIEFMVMEPIDDGSELPPPAKEPPRPQETIVDIPPPPSDRPSEPPRRTPSDSRPIAPIRPLEPSGPIAQDEERERSAEESQKETEEELEARRRAEGISTKNGLKVDPRAVALSALANEYGPSDGPRGSYQEDRPPTLAERRADLNREHSAFLSATANAKDWAIPREAPTFTPRRDGSYTYSGHAFSARINPDGSISFSDREGMNFSDLGTNDGKSAGVRFSFDLADGAHRRRGSDPYRAEREYVMKGSEELREKLMAEHRAKEQERGLRRIEGKLHTIWNASRELAAKRRAIFRVWDELAEDEMGARARSIVIAFVKEHAPKGSPGAYTDEELSALNDRRTSQESFDPYR